MKLLVITQKVDKNDGYFGFFHDWLISFSKECEKLTVISLETGAYELPANVTVLSLGKEHGRSLTKYISRFLGYSWKYRNEYTHVFCHMSPLYVILGAPLWKMLKKPVGLWYIHRNVDLKLKIAEKCADIIFTSTPESFRIESRKRNFMGQAVDLKKFKRPENIFPKEQPFTIISVGRLTPIKNLDILIRATKILKDQGHVIMVNLVGATVTENDKKYEEMLHALVKETGLQDQIVFVGNIPNDRIALHYWQSHLSLNLCPTGGMDKAILESMAAGIPAIVSNEAFRDYFSEYADELIFKLRDEKDCADKIESYMQRPDKEEVKDFLIKRVYERSSLESLIKHIVNILRGVNK